MQPKSVLNVDEIDFSDLEFWMRPLEEREGAFATLRAERPISFQQEPDVEVLPRGEGYWSLTKHADILHTRRNGYLYCAGGI